MRRRKERTTGEEGSGRKDGMMDEGADRRIKMELQRRGECERESGGAVIALQRSSDKQHLRASVVK